MLKRSQFLAALGLPVLARPAKASVPNTPYFAEGSVCWGAEGGVWKNRRAGFPGEWELTGYQNPDIAPINEPKHPTFVLGESDRWDKKNLWICVEQGFPGRWELVPTQAYHAIRIRARRESSQHIHVTISGLDSNLLDHADDIGNAVKRALQKERRFHFEL